jgi:O-antigen/teichoic acid export membrane protein
VVNEAPSTDSSPTASIDELSGPTLLAGGVWVIASSALPQVYVLASSILIARFLSVDDMGLQSFIAFVSASIVFVCSFGLSGSLVRYGGELLGRDELDTLRGLVWWTARIQLVGALLAGAVVATIGLFSHDEVLWMWAAVGTTFGTIVNIPASVLFVLRRWREASVITLVIGLAYTIAIAIVLSLGWGLAGVFGIGTILGGIAAVWTSALAWRRLNSVAPQRGAHAALHRPVLGYAITIWAGFLLTLIVLRRSEFFFLERYATTKAIAYYSVAFAVISGFGSAVEALAGVVAPTVASLHGSGETDRIGPAFSRALRLVLLVSVPITALGIVFGPALIRIIYGSDYARTAAPLRIMLVPFPLLALMALSGGLLWGSGRVRLWLLVFCFAAVVDLTLDFVLVPHLAEVGAALANSCAQVTAAVFVLGYTIRSFGPIDWQARVLARAVGVAVAAAGAGWLGIVGFGGPAGIVVGGLAALLVFAVLSRVLRTVPAIDGMWVTTAVRGRVGDAIARVVRGVTAPEPGVDHPNLDGLLVIDAGLRAPAERTPPHEDQ